MDWKALTFDETPEARAIKIKYDADLAVLGEKFKSKLAEKGRDKPKFPDDEDLIDWYEDERYDLLKWRERDFEDARQEYVKKFNERH